MDSNGSNKKENPYDLLIMGSGPAGLAAAVGAGSEGLHTCVVEQHHKYGGQIGQTSLMENFLGFPDGITGNEFISLAVRQATKFGVVMTSGFEAIHLSSQGTDGDRVFWVRSNDRRELFARSVLLAIGATYRPVGNERIEAFIGRGVHYGSPPLRLIGRRSESAIIVGGANSAGQAALHLAKSEGTKVHLVVRAKSLEEKMSQYLVERIKKDPDIVVHTESELVSAGGDQRVSEVTIRNRRQDTEEVVDADQVYLLIGAIPQTAWLDNCDCFTLDGNGFVLTDTMVPKENWGRGETPPLLFESCQPGAFACGDVRRGAIARCSTAVGEGSGVLPSIHKFLGEKL